jgi:hypothetical protein
MHHQSLSHGGQDLRTQNPKPGSPLAPLKKGGILKAPFLRGLGDLFCVSPRGDTQPQSNQSKSKSEKTKSKIGCGASQMPLFV